MSATKKIIFRLKNLIVRPGAVRFSRQIAREAQLDQETREKLIFQRIQQVVKDAFDHTEFYHEKYSAAGLDDGIIRSMDEFAQLPALGKSDLRNHFDEIIKKAICGTILMKSSIEPFPPPTGNFQRLGDVPDCRSRYTTMPASPFIPLNGLFCNNLVEIFPTMLLS